MQASEMNNNKKLKNTLKLNIELFRGIFSNDDTLVIRQFENQRNNSVKCCVLFIDGMVNNEIINENIIQPVIRSMQLENRNETLDKLQNQTIVSNNVTKVSDVDKLIEAIIYGDTVFLLEGSADALIISTKGWEIRAIEQPTTEYVTRGPREGFTESMMVNLTLIRRKLRTSNLKFCFKKIGERSNTQICICYIESLASEDIINELNKRLDEFNIDGVMDSGYIQELIKDSPFSLFKTIGNTERPDVVAGKLLEGRVALIVDGSPSALTLPYVFIENFQVNEDYYNSFYFASINRLIRIIGFMLTISITAIYVSITTYHHEMIPTPLLLSISAARQGVPFPTIIEALALLFVFEVLREAGTRMPTAIGQALSIVGALVLGQAAVEAKFVSAPMVIVVATAGITGLLVPQLKGSTILIRITFLFLSAFLGMYGLIFGVIGLLIHLFGIRSFGINYMLDFGSMKFQDKKDIAIRAPWLYMYYRPKLIGAKNIIRKSKPNANRGQNK